MLPKTRYFTLRQRARKKRRQRLWQAMRIMRQFTVRELMAACEVEERRTVQAYLSLLRRAGFLRVVHADGARHEPSRYHLIRDSGPHGPSVIHRGRTVWDLNTDKEYPL
ncbi:hypothetical protein MBSD_n1600 [Mizugakiibacter sediminis]|uniref:Uncharacterized protein n=1 Tax=Mizugakiibacter sediminis TaxID=1475481 RepID=A0A0K8QNL6_9GAMM|nr:hypothetical protein [Mizugakiibacter sediminis]GAP66296.1 hypothetical protein MBSD_n1600 [Mizugakiibacter sediminis]